MNIKKEVFGKTAEGEEIYLFTLSNANRITAKISTFGAILVSLEVPDRNGKFNDITLGYDNLEGYINDNYYFGATIGRYADIIPNGKIELNGIEYNLSINNEGSHLHGGKEGFNKKIWKAEELQNDDEIGIKLSYLSKDGEEGYPGNLSVTVTYILTGENELKINYEGETDKTTVISMTNHSYFNFTGDCSADILKHELMIAADKFLPVDKNIAPTGEIKDLKNTEMDFTESEPIGSRIDKTEAGYDNCYVLNSGGGVLSLAARVYEPESGRVMEIFTTEPGVLFYTGNFLDGVKGKRNDIYNKHNGFCLETEHFPNSPNIKNFPSTVLHPGEKYVSTTIYKFYTK